MSFGRIRTRPAPVNRLERASYDQSPPVYQLFDCVTGTGTGDFQKYVKKFGISKRLCGRGIMAIEALEMSKVQQDLCTATKMFHDSTLLYLLPCMVTVHLTQRTKYFGFSHAPQTSQLSVSPLVLCLSF